MKPTPKPWDIPLFTAKMNAEYKFGAKPKLSMQLRDVAETDCSGFTRILWWKSCNVDIGEGSWHQNEFMQKQGYKIAKKLDCFKKDGKLRFLYMPMKNGKPGHVAFCLNGRTYESWGGNGTGSRLFTGLTNFQRACVAYEIP